MATASSPNQTQGSSSPAAQGSSDPHVEPNGTRPTELGKADQFRQKTQPPGPKVRRTKGKLAKLMDMPIDIFTEIALHLQPFDLLCLARASRLFRSMLMSKSSRTMWVRSRKNVPSFGGYAFPDCPPDLSEPEYASLAFDKGCMNCDSMRASRVDYSYRLRSCKTCYDPKFVVLDAVDFCKICHILGGVPDIEVNTILTLVPREHGWGRFFIPIGQRTYEQCMVRKARMTISEYTTFLLERHSMMPLVLENCQNLEDWHLAYAQDRQEQKANSKVERREDITERLLEDGWDARDFPQTAVFSVRAFWDNDQKFKGWTKIVCQAKSLTAKAWATARPRLEEIITYNLTRRLEKEEIERLTDLKRQQREEIPSLYNAFVEEDSTPDTIGSYPTAKEALDMPSMITLLQRIDNEAPPQTEAWHEALDQLREDIQGYQALIRSNFAVAVRDQLRSHAISQKKEPGNRVTTAEDHVNAAFLSKDPSRVSFTWKRRQAESVTKTFPDILVVERDWKVQNQESHVLAPFYMMLSIKCTIEDYDKFKLVDGVWT